MPWERIENLSQYWLGNFFHPCPKFTAGKKCECGLEENMSWKGSDNRKSKTFLKQLWRARLINYVFIKFGTVMSMQLWELALTKLPCMKNGPRKFVQSSTTQQWVVRFRSNLIVGVLFCGCMEVAYSDWNLPANPECKSWDFKNYNYYFFIFYTLGSKDPKG